MNAIDIMVKEHEVITRMLKIIRKISLNILNNKEINYEEFETIIDFIRNCADGHHHNKEEIKLFNKMVENLGAVGEKIIKHGMLVEHDMGRMYVRDLEEALSKVKKGDEEAKLDVIANAISYTHLLERHIEKENNVIYKFAQRELKDEILKEIDIECFKYEEENKDVKNKYIRIVESLEEKYR